MSFLFEPTERQRHLVEGARAVAGAEPVSWPRQVADEHVSFDVRRWREYAKLGWLGDAAGLLAGARQTRHRDALLNIAALVEELGSTLQPEPYVEAVLAVAALGSASARQGQERVLSSVLAGDTLAVWCGPSDVWDPSADPEGEPPRLLPSGQGYRLRGRARAVVDAAAADHLVVAARVPDGSWRHVLVPADAAGIRFEPLGSMDVTRRYADVVFDAAEVEARGLIGDRAGDDVERAVAIAAVLQSAESIGIAGRCLDMTLDYTKQRVVFGRTVASYQAVKHRLATMYLHLEAGRAVTVAAAGGAAAEPVPWLASAAKVYVADTSCTVVEESMQLHGGAAFTWHSDLHLYLRRVRTNRMRFGTQAAHRERIAREVGIPLHPPAFSGQCPGHDVMSSPARPVPDSRNLQQDGG